MEEFNFFNKIGNAFKKVGSDIKNTTNKVASDVSKTVKKVDWNKVGKIAYEGASMVVPIKTFEKISRGEKLNAWDIIDLATMVPIPGVGMAMMAGKVAAKTVAKTVAKEVGKKLIKGIAKKEFNKTKIGKNINNKIKNISSTLSLNKIKRKVYSLKPKQKIKINSVRYNKKTKPVTIEKKELDKIIQQSNKTNINNISKSVDVVIKKDKTLNKDILEMIKNNMIKLNLKLPSEERLKQIVGITAIATPIIIKSKEIYKYNKEIDKEIKKENIKIINKPLVIVKPVIKKSIIIKEKNNNSIYKILLFVFIYFICYLYKKIVKL